MYEAPRVFRRFGVDTHTDRVTETDKVNEKLVMELLKSHFPEHQFIGEVCICVVCLAWLD